VWLHQFLLYTRRGDKDVLSAANGGLGKIVSQVYWKRNRGAFEMPQALTPPPVPVTQPQL
jgi:hypothetical protein